MCKSLDKKEQDLRDHLNIAKFHKLKFEKDVMNLLSENFDTKNGREITLKGFLDLNLMEARDAEGDPNDLWVTFNSMGYNKALESDQV